MNSGVQVSNKKENNKIKLTMNLLKRQMIDNYEPVLVKFDKENQIIRDIRVDKEEFKIGRGRENNEIILSTLISRSHSVLKRDTNGNWTITDLSSSCTLLNNVPLTRGIAEKISEGDTVQFSMSKEFKYLFTLSEKCNEDQKRQRMDDCIFETVLTKQRNFAMHQELKRKELEERLQTKQNQQIELRMQLDKLLKDQELSQCQRQELNNQIVDLQRHIKSGNEAEMQLQDMYNRLLSTLEQERSKFETQLNAERQKWQAALDMSKQEKDNLERNMKEQMEKWRKQQQAEWALVMHNLVQQERVAQECLINEKMQLEKKLKETEDALKSKSTVAASNLQSTTDNETIGIGNLSSIAAQDCIYVEFVNDGNAGEMNILETIDLTLDSPGSSILREDRLLNKVGDIMDEQLTCSICSELFVKAVTLNCMHSFCQHCISLWVKKKHECPVCRAVILAINRSIVLDNFIEQMVENLSPELQTRRKQLLDERKVADKAIIRVKGNTRK